MELFIIANPKAVNIPFSSLRGQLVRARGP
jgi:hypothetical protein